MFLSRLIFDPRSSEARRDLSDPYEMHRTLARVFALCERDRPPRFLWRLDPGNTWSPIVLVQSEAKPDFMGLQSLRNYLSHPPETKEVIPDDVIVRNGVFRFRILANPTVTRAGKRYGLAEEDKQLAWLSRQGERYGFKMEAAIVGASDILNSSKGGRRITVLRVRFDGLLQCCSVEALKRALITGIGPAKAFGCGLLSLARR